jgi:hypothetical protein
MLSGGLGGEDVTIAHDVETVATAVSARRAVMAEVSGDGFVTGIRLLTDTVKGWDTRDFEDRLVAVAAVAHDRYLAGLPNRDGRFPTLDEVAAAERKLQF